MTLDPRGDRPRPSLTPPDFPSPLAQPRVSPAAPIPPAAGSPSVVPVKPRRSGTALIWWAAVLVMVLIALVGYFLSAIGPAASIIGMILALLPLAAGLLAVRLVDR